MSKLDELLIKTAEEAKGIADRKNYGDHQKLTAGTIADLVIQEHLADKAGPHFDYRIGNSDTGLISWATKHPIPKPGERISLFQQPVHNHDYKDFQGKIESGYGKGEVKTNTLGRVLITKVTPDSLQYTIADKRNPQRYVILKPEGWDNWLLLNNTKTKPLPYDKEHLKTLDESEIPKGSIAQPKVDGAAAFTELGKNRAEVYSYRKHKETGDPIVHTERVFGKALQLDVPKNLRGTVLRGELYGESGGKSLEPQDLGGLLNANIENSLTAQKDKGVNLKQMIFDIKRFGNKEVSSAMPYSERKKLIEQALAILPKDKYSIAPEKDAKKLLAEIKAGKNPLTQEGIVIHPPTGPAMKVKLVGEHDVHVTGIFSGEGKHEGRRAGGFTYSLQPGGNDVGRVGTGISDNTREQLHLQPDEYKGRVARIKSQGQHRSGAHRAPSLIAFHEDKTAAHTATDRHGAKYDVYKLWEQSKDLPAEKIDYTRLVGSTVKRLEKGKMNADHEDRTANADLIHFSDRPV